MSYQWQTLAIIVTVGCLWVAIVAVLSLMGVI